MRSVRLVISALVVVSAVACGSDYSSPPTSPSPSPAPAPAAPGPSASVTIPVGAERLGNRAFAPPDLSIGAGTTVTWVNTDRESHTSTSDAAGWNSGTVEPGRQFSFTFQNAGTFTYHCSLHPSMVGTVVVR